jgi:hypothetical protein
MSSSAPRMALVDVAAAAVDRLARDLDGMAEHDRPAAIEAAQERHMALVGDFSASEMATLHNHLALDAVARLGERVKRLEAVVGDARDSFDVKAVAGGPVMKWAGTWASTEQYRRGAVVVDKSALWCCERPVKGVRPVGGPGSGWRLILKSPDRARE